MIVDLPIYNNYKKLIPYRNIYILFHFYILQINCNVSSRESVRYA